METTYWRDKPGGLRVPIGPHLTEVRRVAAAFINLGARDVSHAVSLLEVAQELGRDPSNLLRTIRGVPGFVKVSKGRRVTYYYNGPDIYPDNIGLTSLMDAVREVSIPKDRTSVEDAFNVRLNMAGRKAYRMVNVPALPLQPDKVSDLFDYLKTQAAELSEQDLDGLVDYLINAATAYAYLKDKDDVK